MTRTSTALRAVLAAVPAATPDECLPWPGTVDPGTGYGKVSVGNRRLLAHRAVWQATRGPIPAETPHLDHLCSNRICVNPWHLEPVTVSENNWRSSRWPSTPTDSHCLNGHPWSDYAYADRYTGSRRCRACTRDHVRRSNAKRRARIAA